uniref:Uncharacterized protein n=1 Tax=Chenopodium quinoa TaxID=63459 RepID=A0A803M839_CHEQI
MEFGTVKMYPQPKEYADKSDKSGLKSFMVENTKFKIEVSDEDDLSLKEEFVKQPFGPSLKMEDEEF